MSHQYHSLSQYLPTAPLLDQQSNPTPLLISFSNNVFNYLDHTCEPKGTCLIEESKMAAMQAIILPHEYHVKMKGLRPVLYNSYYIAFSIETTFSVNGPAVTRAGFLKYLRVMIMSDPDEAFKDFKKLSQKMLLGRQLSRSQFPREADPRAKNIDTMVKGYISNALIAIGRKVYQSGFCDICVDRLVSAYHSCQVCDNYAVCHDCIALAPKKHNPVHRFKFTGSRDMIHEGVRCDICSKTVVGVRYKCMGCINYDVCQGCRPLAPKRHNPHHIFHPIERARGAFSQQRY